MQSSDGFFSVVSCAKPNETAVDELKGFYHALSTCEMSLALAI